MVKCSECGFLALRNRITRGLDETEQEYRMTADEPMVERPGALGTVWRSHEGMPICFVMAAELVAEVVEYRGFQTSSEDLLASVIEPTLHVITKERECSEWTKWIQGFTPKEHREMLDRERLLKWQEESRKADRRWRIIELMAFIFAGAATAILAALIERGTLFGNVPPPMP